LEEGDAMNRIRQIGLSLALVATGLDVAPPPASAQVRLDCCPRWYTFQAGDGLKLEVPWNGGYYGGEVSATGLPGQEWTGRQYFLVCDVLLGDFRTPLKALYSNTTKQYLFVNRPLQSGNFVWATGPFDSRAQFFICDYDGNFLQTQAGVSQETTMWVHTDHGLTNSPLRVVDFEGGTTLFRSTPRLNDVVPDCNS
jgi:hypothetical protein